MNGVRHFLLAVQFFTRLPITGRLAAWVGYSPAMLRASAGHFPGVGLLVGVWAGLVYAALMLALPDTGASVFVAAALSTAASVWLTGAFHEDGLADTCDALGGRVSRERALAIMKDSRIGSYGAVALVLALLAKVALLALLGSFDVGASLVVAALLVGHSASRACALVIIAVLPYVRDADTDPGSGGGQKSKPLADSVDGSALAMAGAWLLLAVGLAMTLESAFSLSLLLAGAVAAALALAWMHRLLKTRLQGFTGDGLGATQQVCEIAFYLGVAIGLGSL